MATEEQRAAFWRTLLRSVEVEPRPASSIRGASGFSHPVVSVGVDEDRRRVVIISGESDARSAALAHGDIQAAMPSLKVMMARPVPLNLGEAARIFTELLGRVSFGQRELDWLSAQDRKDEIEKFAAQLPERINRLIIEPMSIASVNRLAVWKEVIQQLALIEVGAAQEEQSASEGAKPQTKMPTVHLTNSSPSTQPKRIVASECAPCRCTSSRPMTLTSFTLARTSTRHARLCDGTVFFSTSSRRQTSSRWASPTDYRRLPERLSTG